MVEILKANVKYTGKVNNLDLNNPQVIQMCIKENDLLIKKRELCSKLQGEYAEYFEWDTNPIPENPRVCDFEDKVVLKVIKELYDAEIFEECVLRLEIDTKYRLVEKNGNYEYEIFDLDDWSRAGQGNQIDIYVIVHDTEDGLIAGIGNEDVGALYPKVYFAYDENGDIKTPLGNFNSEKRVLFKGGCYKGEFLL